jgi:hypothetical protein
MDVYKSARVVSGWDNWIPRPAWRRHPALSWQAVSMADRRDYRRYGTNHRGAILREAFCNSATRPAAICAPAAVACAVSLAVEGAPADDVLADDIAQQYCPDKTENIVPLAISLALTTESAEVTALLAANIGGDSDSVASIGGAIAGALCPERVNERWFEVVSSVNGDAILEIAVSLAAMRPQR